jgi:hypothetical protein
MLNATDAWQMMMSDSDCLLFDATITCHQTHTHTQSHTRPTYYYTAIVMTLKQVLDIRVKKVPSR